MEGRQAPFWGSNNGMRVFLSGIELSPASMKRTYTPFTIAVFHFTGSLGLLAESHFEHHK
jgi:hypothetical protein